MAGVEGFEPSVHATKKRCLTAWLHPNYAAGDTTRRHRDQVPDCVFCSEIPLFLRSFTAEEVIIGQGFAFRFNNLLQCDAFLGSYILHFYMRRGGLGGHGRCI